MTKNDIKRDSAPTKPNSAKKVRLSPRVRKAIRLMLTGDCKTQKAAAKRVGIDATHLCAELKKPKYVEFIARETRKTIAGAQIQAAATAIRLLGANSEHVQKDVAFKILEIEGVAPDPKGPTVSVNVIPGYVIKLKHLKDDKPKTIDVTPEQAT